MSRLAMDTIAIVVAAGVLVMLKKLFKKEHASDAWVGSVVRVDQSYERVRIYYARMDGRTGVLTLDVESFESQFAPLKPGDRLRKIAGDALPRRAEPAVKTG